MRFVAALLVAMAFLSGVCALTQTLPQSSLTTPYLLYNYGYGGIVQAPRTVGNAGGTFNIVPLPTLPSAIPANTSLYFQSVACNSLVGSCTWAANSNSLIAPLVTINLATDVNCHISAAIAAINIDNGVVVVSGCDGFPAPNEVWLLVPSGTDPNVFQIQAWGQKNQGVCLSPQQNTGGKFIMKTCDQKDSTQLWSVYSTTS